MFVCHVIQYSGFLYYYSPLIHFIVISHSLIPPTQLLPSQIHLLINLISLNTCSWTSYSRSDTGIMSTTSLAQQQSAAAGSAVWASCWWVKQHVAYTSTKRERGRELLCYGRLTPTKNTLFYSCFLTAALESGRCESILFFLSSMFFCSLFQRRKKALMYFWCEFIEL